MQTQIKPSKPSKPSKVAPVAPVAPEPIMVAPEPVAPVAPEPDMEGPLAGPTLAEINHALECEAAMEVAEGAIAFIAASKGTHADQIRAEILWIYRSEQAHSGGNAGQCGASIVAKWIMRNASQASSAYDRQCASFAISRGFKAIAKDKIAAQASLSLRVFMATGSADDAKDQIGKAIKADKLNADSRAAIMGDSALERATVNAEIHPLLRRLDSNLRALDRAIESKGPSHRDTVAARGRVVYVRNVVQTTLEGLSSVEESILRDSMAI